ncbi:MAG: type II toxin-antitoxin system RelE/ParE family toxin [Chitinophagales bacterium]
MYKIVYRPRALEELEDSLRWYGEKSKKVAENFKEAIKEKIESIKESPKQNPKKYKNYYEAKLKKYPFVIIYVVENERVLIVAIFHQKRNPKKKYK